MTFHVQYDSSAHRFRIDAPGNVWQGECRTAAARERIEALLEKPYASARDVCDFIGAVERDELGERNSLSHIHVH